MIGSAAFYFYYPDGTHNICYAPHGNFPINVAIDFLLMEKKKEEYGKYLAFKFSQVNRSLEFVDKIDRKVDYKYIIDPCLSLSVTCYARKGKVTISRYQNYHDFVNWFVDAAKTVNNNHPITTEV